MTEGRRRHEEAARHRSEGNDQNRIGSSGVAMDRSTARQHGVIEVR